MSHLGVKTQHSPFTHAGIRESLRDVDYGDSYAGDDITIKPLGIFLHVRWEVQVKFLLLHEP